MNIKEYRSQLIKECEILSATAKASDTKAKMIRTLENVKPEEILAAREQAEKDLLATQEIAVKIQGLTLFLKIGFTKFEGLLALMPPQKVETKTTKTKKKVGK